MLTKLHRYKHLQLTATRSTSYEPLKTQELSSLYFPREATPISCLGRLNTDQLAYKEFDTVGVVVCTCSDHVMSHDQEGVRLHFDHVFVADSAGSLLVIRLWDGLKVWLLMCLSV